MEFQAEKGFALKVCILPNNRLSVVQKKNYDGVFLRCLERADVDKVVKELHDGPAGGHFSGDTMAHNILRAGYYWSTLFKDAHTYVRKCYTR